MSREYHKPRIKEIPPMIAKNGGQLMEFLLTNLPGKNRNNIKTLLNHRQILVNGMVVGFYNHQLQPGDKVQIQKFKAPAEMNFIGMTIVYEDDYLIVVDKHAGMMCSSANKGQNTVTSVLTRHVKQQHPANAVFMVNSLDRETSGLLVYAKSKSVKEEILQEWETAEYSYLAVVEGVMEKNEGVLKSYLTEDKKTFRMHLCQNPDEGQLAVTHVKLMKTSPRYSMLKVNTETNCKNQIRVQLQSIGNPIIGDLRYGATENPIERLGLHAWTLSFRHPMTGKALRFESHVPKKFLHLFDGKFD